MHTLRPLLLSGVCELSPGTAHQQFHGPWTKAGWCTDRQAAGTVGAVTARTWQNTFRGTWHLLPSTLQATGNNGKAKMCCDYMLDCNFFSRRPIRLCSFQLHLQNHLFRWPKQKNRLGRKAPARVIHPSGFCILENNLQLHYHKLYILQGKSFTQYTS